jgi:hypothetical protein
VLQPEREQLVGTAGPGAAHLRDHHARPHPRHHPLQQPHHPRPEPARHGQPHQHRPPGKGGYEILFFCQILLSRSFTFTLIHNIFFIIRIKLKLILTSKVDTNFAVRSFSKNSQKFRKDFAKFR